MKEAAAAAGTSRSLSLHTGNVLHCQNEQVGLPYLIHASLPLPDLPTHSLHYMTSKELAHSHPHKPTTYKAAPRRLPASPWRVTGRLHAQTQPIAPTPLADTPARPLPAHLKKAPPHTKPRDAVWQSNPHNITRREP
ncbi:hypothetical protein E2C01_020774 [Portunus trituberculatus]|uniref:Uncharacterized protein n=1 Tax=Portunus trituberculatus TaxID=210409 RepID=A0A5B7E0U2_PORTR|nr:hypothetical protein [Portunus trituberculatus]